MDQSPVEYDREVIWRMRGITDNVWHFGQQTVLGGRYSLSFQLNGDAVRASVDDIVVLDGECPFEVSKSPSIVLPLERF